MDEEAGPARLHERLARYPADRYPVQHATTQVQLGAALLQAGDGPAAVAALRTALATLPEELALEHARARNLLGVALREAHEPAAAEEVFADAAQRFAGCGRPLEEAAALHNRALVQRDLGEDSAAVEGFTTALAGFEAHQAWAQATASARELAAIRLELGDHEEAAVAASAAAAHAHAAGDLASLGAAENVRGLCELAAGHAARAADAFRRSAGAHPRSVRPDAYAMAKANLALACARLGDAPRARLAAAQALSAPLVPPPVAAQARAILDRLGEDDADLHAVLDDEPAEERTAVLREEVVRWPDLPAPARRRLAGAFLDGLADRPVDAPARTEAWLGVLLELPPAAMDGLIQAALAALSDRPPKQQARVRELVAHALPRFPVPQWTRLADHLDRAARDLGLEAGFGP